MNSAAYIALAIITVIAVAAVVGLYRTRMRLRLHGQVDEIAVLRASLDEGVGYEDEFIKVYMELLKDGGFMGLFGADRPAAESALTTLVTESRGHKQVLEHVLKKIK